MAKKIFTTENYGMFKPLIDNREVKTRTTQKIVESIKTVGYITNPIIVNEQMQIIDGQNRLEALKSLGMPVDYVIVKGAGINHCRALNINQSNWTTMDYIKSYANGGNTSYKYLLNLIEAYPQMKLSVIVFAVNGSVGQGAGTSLKRGLFSCDETQYANAQKRLEFLTSMTNTIRQVDGNSGFLECAVIYAYIDPEVDNVRLQTNLIKYAHTIKPIATFDMALDALEEVYNYRSRRKVYLKTNYLKYNDSYKDAERKRKEQRRHPQRSIKY